MSHREEDRANPLPEIQRTGAIEDPFTDLRSAIEKADEITAPYSLESQTVTIYLSKGPHFVVLSDNFYRARGVSQKVERTYHLVIQ